MYWQYWIVHLDISAGVLTPLAWWPCVSAVHHAVYSIILCMIAALCLTIRCMACSQVCLRATALLSPLASVVRLLASAPAVLSEPRCACNQRRVHPEYRQISIFRYLFLAPLQLLNISAEAWIVQRSTFAYRQSPIRARTWAVPEPPNCVLGGRRPTSWTGFGSAPPTFASWR